MEIYTGDALQEYIADKLFEAFQPRDCFDTVVDFLRGRNDFKVMALYGLRRTGKTVLMAQNARMLPPEQCCIIECAYGDDIGTLRGALDSHLGCTYFFIDEATKLENFVQASSVLADKYARIGKKIVMAGTDSLGFCLASHDELFDRVHMLHTTYIPYKEYHRLLGKSLDDYIMYGGTLTDGSVFYNDDKLNEYVNSAIANNIQHSLAQLGTDGEYGALLEYYLNGELSTFINKQVEIHNQTFLLNTIRKKFKSHDLGNLRNNLQRRENTIDTTPLKSQELYDEVCKALEIHEPMHTKASEKAVEETKKYLEKMDVLYTVPYSQPEKVLFTQPGLRYAQAQQLMQVLRYSPELEKYSTAVREELCENLNNDIKGQLLEEIILYQLLKDAKITATYQIGKFRQPTEGFEFDLVMIHRKKNQAFLFEIKHSTAYFPQGDKGKGQAWQLMNPEACSALEKHFDTKIAGKCVVYMGYHREGTIPYLNAGKFLSNPQKSIEFVRNCFLPTDEIHR